MKILKPISIAVVAMLLAVVPAMRAQAQLADIKPAAVVSVASLSEIKGDLEYLAEAAGLKDNAMVGAGLSMMDLVTAGIDKNRPAGAYVTFGPAPIPDVVVFVPVTDLKGLLALHKENIGEPEDLGGGLMRVDGANGQAVFIKEANGWAFTAQSKDLLSATPADPSALLAGLNKEYTIAVRLNVRNIPAPLRGMAIAKIQEGFEESLAGLDGDEREFAEGLGRKQVEMVSRLVEESDQVTLGWAVDSMAKKTYIDFSMTAIDGSRLAKSMSMAAESTTAFAGFLKEGAAVNLNFARQLHADDIAQYSQMLKVLSAKAIQELEKDADLDSAEAKAAAKDVLGSLIGVLQKTVETGKVDGGAALVLAPESIKFAAGGHISDGPELERILKKIVELGKNEADFPAVKLDADSHKGVRFHTMSIPIPEGKDEPRKFFGDNLGVAVGIGANSVYLAFGKDSIDTLKGIIDALRGRRQQIGAARPTQHRPGADHRLCRRGK